MAKSDLTATMVEALDEAMKAGGRLVRHQGGYWTPPGVTMRGGGSPFDWWASTPTINALVARGRMHFTELREGRNGSFPVAVEVIA